MEAESKQQEVINMSNDERHDTVINHIPTHQQTKIRSVKK